MMVKLFICPADASLPPPSSSSASKKRSRDHHDLSSSTDNKRPAFSSQQRSGGGGHDYAGKKRGNGRDNSGGGSGYFAERKEMQDIMSSIKDLSATTFKGMARLKHKNDKLTELGAYRVKEQTMPLKMALGIRAGREKRKDKAIARAKESGTVLASSVTAQSSKSNRRHTSDDDDGGGGGGLNVSTKRGVLHLSKKRLPERLITNGFRSAAIKK